MFSREHGEWEVTKTAVTSSVISETRNGVTRTHSQLDFWVYLKRRDQFYNTNIMLPMVLSSVLVMLVFTVPVESGEKLSYILTVLLTIAVFLTIVGDTLPAISLTTSILGKFLSFFFLSSFFLSFFLSFCHLFFFFLICSRSCLCFQVKFHITDIRCQKLNILSNCLLGGFFCCIYTCYRK